MSHINKKLKSDDYSGKLEGASHASLQEDGLTPLHLAAENGSVEEAELLLKKGCDVNALNEDGDSPLHIAVINGQDKMVTFLLDHGANIDSLSKKDRTPLLLAVENRLPLIVKELLKYRPCQSTVYNGRALDIAVRKSEPIYNDIVKDLLEYGFLPFVDISDFEPLFNSIEREDTETVEKLLNFGYAIKDAVTDDKTLLHCATEKKNIEIIKQLIKHGHDINAKDNLGLTPLCYAILQRDLEIVKLFLITNASVKACDLEGKSPLHYTVSSQFLRNESIEIDDGVEMARLLLKEGADINSKQNNGMTTLHSAAEAGCISLVEVLLKHKADVNARDNDGNTPLHFAANKQEEVVTELLLINGAMVDAKDARERTALMGAIFYPHENEATVKLLLKYNSDVNSRDLNGITPLFLAAQYCNEEIIRIILSRGANVETKSKDGYGVLHAAIENAYDDLGGDIIDKLKLLFEYGAEPNSRGKYGMTPLHIATMLGGHEVAEVLLNNGADINITDDEGRTPLGYSTELSIINIALKEHTMKLKVADLFVSAKNIKFINSDSKVNESIFEEEINKMKIKISNTDVSFYDILTNRKNILVGLDDEEESVFQVLKSDDYKAEYPLYAYLLSRPMTKIRKAINRIELLRSIHTFFGSYSNHFMKLPHECKEEIFTYLSDKDLKCFENFKLTN